jgi:hypothetical protein
MASLSTLHWKVVKEPFPETPWVFWAKTLDDEQKISHIYFNIPSSKS